MNINLKYESAGRVTSYRKLTVSLVLKVSRNVEVCLFDSGEDGEHTHMILLICPCPVDYYHSIVQDQFLLRSAYAKILATVVRSKTIYF